MTGSKAKRAAPAPDDDPDRKLERITGISAASLRGKSMAELEQMEVASAFMLSAHFYHDREEAKRDAVRSIFEGHASPIEKLIPHIERVIRRKLLPEEIAAGALAA